MPGTVFCTSCRIQPLPLIWVIRQETYGVDQALWMRVLSMELLEWRWIHLALARDRCRQTNMDRRPNDIWAAWSDDPIGMWFAGHAGNVYCVSCCSAVSDPPGLGIAGWLGCINAIGADFSSALSLAQRPHYRMVIGYLRSGRVYRRLWLVRN